MVHLSLPHKSYYLIYLYETRWNNNNSMCILCKPNSHQKIFTHPHGIEQATINVLPKKIHLLFLYVWSRWRSSWNMHLLSSNNKKFMKISWDLTLNYTKTMILQCVVGNCKRSLGPEGGGNFTCTCHCMLEKSATLSILGNTLNQICPIVPRHDVQAQFERHNMAYDPNLEMPKLHM